MAVVKMLYKLYCSNLIFLRKLIWKEKQTCSLDQLYEHAA